MQEYKKILISQEEVRPLAQRMRESGIPLAMIHAFLRDDGKGNVSYEYEVGSGIESYTVDGVNELPTISDIYDLGAEWPEREISELLPITFTGLDTSQRLFLPDTLIGGQGQILVLPMEKVIEKTRGKEGGQ
ncbi:MAG: NADH-quinone oxidoreductase subunit C [Lachnospiraceae bacterium]|nr:NADH-quinone oxidoreductase subunit C [Lachnospiraceae bacterium]